MNVLIAGSLQIYDLLESEKNVGALSLGLRDPALSKKIPRVITRRNETASTIITSTGDHGPTD